MKIRNLKIGTRLMGLLGLVLVLMATISILAQRNLTTANGRLQEMYQSELQPIRVTARIQRLLEDTRVQILLGLQHNPQSELVKLHDHALSFHSDAISKALNEAEAAWKELSANREIGAPEKAQLEAFEKSMRAYMTEGLAPAFKALVAGDFAQANVDLLKKTNPANAALRQAATALSDYYTNSAENAFKQANASHKQASAWMLGTGILAAVLAIVFGLRITRSITTSLKKAIHVAQRVAAGDLTGTIEVKTTDEAGMLLQALRNMNQELADLVGRVRTSVETISTGSHQIAAGNADLSSRTEQQASSLEETASSMEELTGTVKQNAEHAREANQLAAGASTLAVKGGEVVGQVVHSMSSINESSRKIAEIIGVIDGIAFQTNILALNAAVEAARAGEQGRGFAVVASEVRTLAQRSAAAAKEIKTLITDSVAKVDDGTKLVDQAGHTMEEIVTAVKRVTDIMAEIASASQEQTSGIEQVNQAIVQMDQVTQQNAALVEEAAAAAESMQEQAQDLTKAVAIFKLSAANASVLRDATAPQHERGNAVRPEGAAGTRSKGNGESPSPRTRVEGGGEGKAERRSPNRATNVARLPKPAPQPKAAKTANGDDNWQEF